MKKISSLLFFTLISLFVVAQKASIKNREVTLNFEQPTLFKNAKTISYDLQDDGKYWNFTQTEEHANLASFTEGISLGNLELVTENADIQVVVGFIGNQLKVNNSLIQLNGTYNIMLLNKDNQLITSFVVNMKKSVVVNPTNYPMDTRDNRNITKAKLVTDLVQKFLDTQNYLFTGESKEKLPFGLFKKTKGGAAAAFNKTSEPLIDDILKDVSNVAALDKAITYWNEQLTTDFGKKVKAKIKNKVIYANLTSAAILKNDLEKAKEYTKIIKKNTGFFDVWNLAYDKLFKKYEMIESFDKNKLTPIHITSNFAYYIVLDGGKYIGKRKEIEFSKIEIQRFIPSIKSGIASLDKVKKPSFYIYENDVKTLRYFGDDSFKIITNDGKEIVFKEIKSVFYPHIKLEDGSYALYER